VAWSRLEAREGKSFCKGGVRRTANIVSIDVINDEGYIAARRFVPEDVNCFVLLEDFLGESLEAGQVGDVDLVEDWDENGREVGVGVRVLFCERSDFGY
jgi:hypothetical protein